MSQPGTEYKEQEPAWVKLSTGFKQELAGLDVYALKVYLYIGMSINYFTGEAFPGYRRIAKDTGMAVNTVQKAVDNLERLGLLTVKRNVGVTNLFKPIRYITIGPVSPQDTPQRAGVSNQDETVQNDEPSNEHDTPPAGVSFKDRDRTVPGVVYHEKDGLYHEKNEPYHENPDVYQGCEGDLHNKSNKNNNNIKQEDSEDQTHFRKILLNLHRLCIGTPRDADLLIRSWMEKHPPVRIHQAIEEARDRRARSANYVDVVLRKWLEDGYPNTREEILEKIMAAQQLHP